MDSLSFNENTEYEIILSKLKLDIDRKEGGWVPIQHISRAIDQQVYTSKRMHGQDGGQAGEDRKAG
jgi:hypothetical protein